MRYHMLLGRTSTMSCTWDMLVQHGDHFRLGKPLILKISQSHWFQYVNYFVRAQSMAECSGFAVIGCLVIRLSPVSFHARDDNNGRCCQNACWHHYSYILPHASIITCCKDALRWMKCSLWSSERGHTHTPSHMREAQQVNKKGLHHSFFFFSPPLISLVLLILPLSRQFWSTQNPRWNFIKHPSWLHP